MNGRLYTGTNLFDPFHVLLSSLADIVFLGKAV